MTTLRANSCPYVLRQLRRNRNPWNKRWFQALIMAGYRRDRLARIMAVERRRVLPDWLWAEKRRLLEAT